MIILVIIIVICIFVRHEKMWQDMCRQDLISHLYMKEFRQIVAYFAIRTETVLQRLSVQIDPKIRSEFDGVWET